MATTDQGHGADHGHAGHVHGPGCSHHADAGVAADTRATDPVCGMKVDPATARLQYDTS